MMNRSYGAFMGEILGDVKDADVEEDGVGWGPFLRVRVSIDIFKPLLRGNLITLDNSLHWIPFKNERLLNFCFKCGIIKHPKSRCPRGPSSNKLHEKETVQYGAWLRAFPAKIPWKNHFQKSNSGLASFEKNRGTEEEDLPIEFNQGVNFHN